MKVQVILREQELNEAIKAYITAQGYPVNDMDIKINLIKGRSGFGSTRAEVDLTPAGEEVEDSIVEEIVDEIEETVEEAVEVVEDIVEDVVDTVEEVVEEVTEAITDAYEDVKNSLFSSDKEEEEVAEDNDKEEVVKTHSLFS